jgi:hypothetical protein
VAGGPCDPVACAAAIDTRMADSQRRIGGFYPTPIGGRDHREFREFREFRE